MLRSRRVSLPLSLYSSRLSITTRLRAVAGEVGDDEGPQPDRLGAVSRSLQPLPGYITKTGKGPTIVITMISTTRTKQPVSMYLAHGVQEVA